MNTNTIKTLLAVLLLVWGVASNQIAMAQNPDGIGLNQLLVLVPGQSDTIAPGIVLDELDKYTQVQFPPVVHVHRMFYSKSEKIQGPIVKGGQHIVVAKHPDSNETCYIEVMLPVGAPEIRYEHHSITYLYPDQRVQVNFVRPILGRECVEVKYSRHDSPLGKVRDWKRRASENVRFGLSTSRITNGFRDSAVSTREFAKGVSASIGQSGDKIRSRLKEGAASLPGLNEIKELGRARLAERPFANSDLLPNQR